MTPLGPAKLVVLQIEPRNCLRLVFVPMSPRKLLKAPKFEVVAALLIYTAVWTFLVTVRPKSEALVRLSLSFARLLTPMLVCVVTPLHISEKQLVVENFSLVPMWSRVTAPRSPPVVSFLDYFVVAHPRRMPCRFL